MAERVYGIDPGTGAVKIVQKNIGVVLHQKTMIAVAGKKNAIAIGDEAFEMYEKVPRNIEVRRPLINGVIDDFTALQVYFQILFKGLKGEKICKALVSGNNSSFFIAAPTDISEVEKRAFYELIASSSLRSKKIRLVEKPLADALGAGIDILNTRGNLVVDIGADTTEISLISQGTVVYSALLHIGGLKLDEQIQNEVKKKHNLVIGMRTAERIKIRLASAIPGSSEQSIEVLGRNLITGLPNRIRIMNSLVDDALREDLLVIMNSIHYALDQMPPDIARNIKKEGIFLTGGSANMRDMDRWIRQETGLEVFIPEKPEFSVVRGMRSVIEDRKIEEKAVSIQESLLR